MRYLLLLYGDPEAEAALDPAARRAIVDAHVGFGRRLREAGALVDSDALEPPSAGRVVRAGLVTDGPFAETKEQLGGFYLLECPDLEEAIEWAAKIPGAKSGTIEVRPIMEFS